MTIDANALNIYTDGSSYSNPRRGGMAIRFVFPEYLNRDSKDVCPPGYIGATNNMMEIKACSMALIESLKMAREWNRIVIYTDSSYVCGNLSTARNYWSKNKWFKSGGAPVSNVAEWKELLKSIGRVGVPVDIVWIKGHAKDENNKAVDKLAKKSSLGKSNNPLKTVLIRRKTSGKMTETGSIKMLDQRLDVKIVSGEYLKEHRMSRYRYEVISKKSEYYGYLDFIYSKIPLRAGHDYRIKVNNIQVYPQIVSVIKDLTEERRKNSDKIVSVV